MVTGHTYLIIHFLISSETYFVIVIYIIFLHDYCHFKSNYTQYFCIITIHFYCNNTIAL